jgi:hypothetical protein
MRSSYIECSFVYLAIDDRSVPKSQISRFRGDNDNQNSVLHGYGLMLE